MVFKLVELIFLSSQFIRTRDSLSLSDLLTFKDNHLVTTSHKSSWRRLHRLPCATCLVLHSRHFFGFPSLSKIESYGSLIFNQPLQQLLCCHLEGAHFNWQGSKTRLSPRDSLQFTPWQCQFICCQSQEIFKAICLWISSQHPDHTSNWLNQCKHFCVL